jgi:hypothetical protein
VVTFLSSAFCIRNKVGHVWIWGRPLYPFTKSEDLLKGRKLCFSFWRNLRFRKHGFEKLMYVH